LSAYPFFGAHRILFSGLCAAVILASVLPGQLLVPASASSPVEVVEVSLDDEVEDQLGLIAIVGRMHPAVVHFPIAWLLLLSLVDFLALGLGLEELRKYGPYLLGLTILSFCPAATSGFLNYAEYGEPNTLAGLHRNLMLTAVGLCAVGLVLRLLGRNRLDGALKWVYLGLLGAAALTVSVGGHLGGKLVFGEDYLPF